MSKARTLANLISDNAELADGQISVAEVVGAAPLASPTFTGTASGTFSGPLTGNVTGNLTGAVTGDVTAPEIDLTAISSTIADTAVDVFVYDTSKDSDGGAWRKRTQHTSWYNETLNTSTRGSRKEFPSVAVIVAESNQVTIYDGDDPDLPMWMVFNNNSNCMIGNTGAISSVIMLNAELCVGRTSASKGLGQISFLTEVGKTIRRNSSGYLYIYKGNIEQRNDNLEYNNQNDSTQAITGDFVYDVDMTVLPNAPIDAATGLPVPTIAVATDGGVSVIKDDGTVVDIIHNNGSYNETHYVVLSEDNTVTLAFNNSGGVEYGWVYTLKIPSSDTTITVNAQSPAVSWFDTRNPLGFNQDFWISNTGGTDGVKLSAIASKFPKLAFGTTTALTNTVDNLGTEPYLFNYITSDYNTGWMNGDIKLATLSDTDDTDVTGSELVTNGTFDTNTTGWTNKEGDGTFTSSSSQGVLTYGTGATAFQQDVSVTIGKTYTIVVEYAGGTSTIAQAYYRDSTDVGLGTITEPTPTTLTKTVTATTSSIKVFVRVASSGTAIFDNISVRLAEEDRSVNGNGLQVFGTVTKNPVATGADLVAYSGFAYGSGNYLKQPYNSDLDFGTGDFCFMGWANITTTSGDSSMLASVEYSGGTAPDDGDWLYRGDGGSTNIKFYIRASGAWSYVQASSGIVLNTWQHHCVVRQNGITTIYVNGVPFVSSDNLSGKAFNNQATGVTVGSRFSYSGEDTKGSLALWRISATAPSPEQIKKIYEDEKVLFQENAQATLYGSSDAVTALAYDDSTELLHVGTSAGRSVFQGLRRVDNTTDAVGAAISASNGLVAED